MHQPKDEQGRFTSPNPEPLAEKALSVRVPVSLDQVVRSLPNRPEWLRDAVIEKAEREGLIQQRGDTAEMSLEDRAWMDADLSRLGEFEPYDWGEVDPLSLGEPLHHEAGRSLVVGDCHEG